MKKFIFDHANVLDDFEYAYSPICKEHAHMGNREDA